MFSKGKSGHKLLENNPILGLYEVGRLYATAGPEGVWKIYEGVSKTDGKVVIFLPRNVTHSSKIKLQEWLFYFCFS